jgi:SPP1 family predicted phage head-tail adaptor
MTFAQTLNDLVTIQQPGTTRDALGQEVVGDWVPLDADVWANVKYLNGLQTIKADAQTSVVKVSIRLRYRTDIEAGMRAVFGSTVFEIDAVLPDSRKVYVDLVCKVVA